MGDIWYTDKDGSPDDFGLGNRWIETPLDPSKYQQDTRQKIRLIGDIISDAVEKGLPVSLVASEIHKALISGRIKASGRLRILPYGDGEPAELHGRVVISPEDFAPLYSSEHYQKCCIGHEAERKSYWDEWTSFDWLDSSIEYFAWNEGDTWTRYICRWSQIMINQEQAYKILSKANPAFRRHVRAGYNRPIKTDKEILAKAEEMKQGGMTVVTDIAREIKHEPGFEFVQNLYVRQLLWDEWGK